MLSKSRDWKDLPSHAWFSFWRVANIRRLQSNTRAGRFAWRGYRHGRDISFFPVHHGVSAWVGVFLRTGGVAALLDRRRLVLRAVWIPDRRDFARFARIRRITTPFSISGAFSGSFPSIWLPLVLPCSVSVVKLGPDQRTFAVAHADGAPWYGYLTFTQNFWMTHAGSVGSNGLGDDLVPCR